MSRYHVPTWILAVPLLPLAFVMIQGLFSQRRKLTADSGAAEITGDLEITDKIDQPQPASEV